MSSDLYIRDIIGRCTAVDACDTLPAAMWDASAGQMFYDRDAKYVRTMQMRTRRAAGVACVNWLCAHRFTFKSMLEQ